ncbi:MAG: hypothetical protein COU68_04310 [Candidatus Pacebacteria bacterium CG10_big_fil_rev_8_21_14_0_10_45_6]|nr:MAG: hypothetical protein COU68_04310 [Candidatus Pacebacteria bacterium CG10_big_fil_rev_8_21_14_0_10_45_6]
MHTNYPVVDSRFLYTPDSIDSLADHTMKWSLLKYAEIKLHHYFFEKEFDEVVVKGCYNRNSCISKYEKTGKIINEHRPTAKMSGRQLTLECFPGTEYIRHFAAVVSTYIRLSDWFKDKKIRVVYALPSEAEMFEAVRGLNILDIPLHNTVITGWGLFDIFPEVLWQEHGTLVWSEVRIGREDVTVLGFKNTFWGDILGRICKLMIEEGGVKTIIYTAKAGGINPSLVPNVSIVTGDTSLIEGEVVRWKNLFNDVTYEHISKATHINSPSAIFESNEWFQLLGNFDIVESEIGHCARMATRLGSTFSYVHFISNTLTTDFRENLSNERDAVIISKREKLKRILRSIISEAILSSQK